MEQTTEYSPLTVGASKRERWRLLKDFAARHLVAIGGISVIIAILLIFFYLLYIVYPLFIPANAERMGTYAVPGGQQAETLHLASDELGDMAVRYTADGRAVFFRIADGETVEQKRLTPDGMAAASVAPADPASGELALGLPDGRALVVKHSFEVSFPDDKRTVTPQLSFPYGEQPLDVAADAGPLEIAAMRDSEDQLMFAGQAGGKLHLVVFSKETSFLSDEVTLERQEAVLPELDIEPRFLLIGPDQRWLYVAAADGEVIRLDVSDAGQPKIMERAKLVDGNARLTSLRFLIGGYSLLAGTSEGTVSQWFPVRDDQNRYSLTRIRDFQLDSAPVTAIADEQRRKGFLVADGNGRVGFYNSTAHNRVLVEQVADGAIAQLMVSPRADVMLAQTSSGQMQYWHVENEHPEVSWSSLWGKVHYEGYQEPRYIWQSSSASNDFEPKFSLMPLSFGTIKAAFYAMLFAAPLAIFGAIYTAYFMSPRMRQVVKPTIEIMEALPTVILGFLAGLWLAPYLEANLPGVLALLIIMPMGVLIFGFTWAHMPARVRSLVPEGWEAALLIPVVFFFGWLSLQLSVPLEEAFFGGNVRQWLGDELGISFDQRNSLVVGLAMGFAVIPTIFSITEDAIFSVPKHLTFGSLALGATPWQTLTRVVILTASPGIFSALMIGLGRAVGETMIVLMATGNTPVMDFSIFQGMRTLSANIAVEMPESEVGSTHYRVLFLAALVLFMFTFAFNTLAEVIRQRLRRKYSSL